MKEQSHVGDAKPFIPKKGQQTHQNTPSIGSQLGRADVEMLKNLFYEGVQWKTKTVIKGNFIKSRPYQARRRRKRSKHQETIFGHQAEADNVQQKQIRMKDQLY